ncbi:MAG: RHS repeat-associated core domain-containing protein [Flavobacteriaceae bacterium]|nr:RHS repeat-associated core domain-containing protein [Flavobacteriaceae bacterium]
MNWMIFKNRKSLHSLTTDTTPSITTDYYPFGMAMPNRTRIGGEVYRYNYQGQEKDSETGKEAFELRLWDGRLGRWLTTDPAGQYASPYLGMGNNPISMMDPDGGWSTKAGQWIAWAFNGFKGERFTSDVAGGIYKYGIELGDSSMGVDMVFGSNGMTMSNLDSWDMEIMSRSSFNFQGGSLSRQLSRIKRRDWHEASREVMRGRIGSVYKAGASVGMMGSGFGYGAATNSARTVSRTVSKAYGGIDDVVTSIGTTLNSNLNNGKRRLINYSTSKIVPKLSFSLKRSVIKYNLKSKTLKFMMKEHYIINSENLLYMTDKVMSINKKAGGTWR